MIADGVCLGVPIRPRAADQVRGAQRVSLERPSTHCTKMKSAFR